MFNAIIAIFTSIPLKNIEKLVLTSTCVLVIQKEKGHEGIFTAKPKKRINYTNLVYLKCFKDSKL